MCLGTWSGITWIMEVIGFIFTTYSKPPDGNWSEYLWYIPSSINALRGIGVFVILVFVPKDSRSYLFELLNNAWEGIGGKPLSRLIPSTRRSSTSTTTTATTTATASPTAPGDKERISLSSSDTQLSSHTASMSELHELPRQNDAQNAQACKLPITTSTSLTTKPSGVNATKNSSGLALNESKSSLKSNSKSNLSIENNSSEKLNAHNHSKKSSDGLPVKPPRKSIDLATRASFSVENLSKSCDGESTNLHMPPKTPPPQCLSKSSPDLIPCEDSLRPQADSSPETPPESPPPTPPTSPPPKVLEHNEAVEDTSHLPEAACETSQDNANASVNSQQELHKISNKKDENPAIPNPSEVVRHKNDHHSSENLSVIAIPSSPNRTLNSSSVSASHAEENQNLTNVANSSSDGIEENALLNDKSQSFNEIM